MSKKMGRPRIPAHLHAKPISKTVRFPIPAAKVASELSKGLKSGLITVDDVLRLIASKQNNKS